MYIYLGNYLCLDLKEDFLHLFNFSQLKQVSFLWAFSFVDSLRKEKLSFCISLFPKTV